MYQNKTVRVIQESEFDRACEVKVFLIIKNLWEYYQNWQATIQLLNDLCVLYRLNPTVLTRYCSLLSQEVYYVVPSINEYIMVLYHSDYSIQRITKVLNVSVTKVYKVVKDTSHRFIQPAVGSENELNTLKLFLKQIQNTKENILCL